MKKDKLIALSIRIPLIPRGKTGKKPTAQAVFSTVRVGAEDLEPQGHPKQSFELTEKELAPLRKRAEEAAADYYDTFEDRELVQ